MLRPIGPALPAHIARRMQMHRAVQTIPPLLWQTFALPFSSLRLFIYGAARWPH